MSIRQRFLPLELPSHRTRAEQAVGLGIYLIISLGFSIAANLNAAYALFLALGMWALWRRYSLRVLKLELFVFLSQFPFQMLLILKEPLLILVALLLLSCNTMLATLLFWKKERVSGMLYVIPLLWVFYLAFSNMIECIANP